MISPATLNRILDVTVESSPEVRRIFDAVVAKFESRTKRKWSTTTMTQVFEPEPEESALFLSVYPVTSVSSVIEKESLVDTDPTTLVVDTDVAIQMTEGVLRNQRSAWAKVVSIAYTGGYAIDAAPADVLNALAYETARMLLRNCPDKIVVSRTRIQDGLTDFIDSDKEHPEFLRTIQLRMKRARNF